MRMKREEILWIIAVAMTVFFVAGCSGKEKTVHEEDAQEKINREDIVEPKQEDPVFEVDPREILFKENHFSLEFFGINMTMPDDWHIMTDEELAIIEATGSAITEATSEVVNLVAISERPLDTEPVFNPSLLMNTYESDLEGVEDIIALMEDVEKTLVNENLGFDFDSPVETTYFGNLKGVEMGMSLKVDETLRIHQLFFVTVKDGWVLELTATYSQEEDVLFKIMLNR